MVADWHREKWRMRGKHKSVHTPLFILLIIISFILINTMVSSV